MDNVIADVVSILNIWSGFLIDASPRNKFKSCKSILNDGRGYYFKAASTSCELVGSDAINNGQDGGYPGVEIEDSDRVKVTAGVFTDDQAIKTQTYGIKESGTSDYSDIHGVDAAGNLTGDILLTGPNSVETDNM